jgi:tetratricopeptide (TPR) repeat protein
MLVRLSSSLIPWEIRLGAMGEAQIKGKLLYFSIPQKTEIDLGIDFYCELLVNDNPEMPFYVQAKGTEHFDKSFSVSIKKTTIRYWLSRPFPVFLIVYDGKNDECYWMAIEDYRYRLQEKLQLDNSETISFTLDRSRRLEKGKGANLEFKAKIAEGHISIQQFHGHPQFEGDGYVKKVPKPPRSEIELARTIESIRISMYSLVVHYWLQAKNLNEAYFYCNFLTELDQAHYNHFVWFGLINKELGNRTAARDNLEKALTICRGDKNWPKESMEQIIDYIKSEIDKLG